MAVNLSPIWGAGAQLFDNSGNVLTGGKIYTYAAGTTTPATTYTSSNGITANSNPIILNSAGRVPYEIWLTDGSVYKFVLKDSNDTLIATYDNLIGINSNFIAYTAQQEIQTATAGQTVFNLTTMNYQPGTNSLSVFVDGVNQYGPGAQYAYVETDSDIVTFVSGLHVGASVKFTTAESVSSNYANAAQVTYDPPFTDAVATNVEAKLAETMSVKDFGATGNGVTDDTAAIQAAINAAEAANSDVVFPPGTYISSSLTVTGITLRGPGTLKWKNSATTATHLLSLYGGACLEDGLVVDGNYQNNSGKSNATTDAMVFIYEDGSRISGCKFINAPSTIIFGLLYVSQVVITNNYFRNCRYYGVIGKGSWWVVSNNTFQGTANTLGGTPVRFGKFGSDYVPGNTNYCYGNICDSNTMYGCNAPAMHCEIDCYANVFTNNTARYCQGVMKIQYQVNEPVYNTVFANNNVDNCQYPVSYDNTTGLATQITSGGMITPVAIGGYNTSCTGNIFSNVNGVSISNSCNFVNNLLTNVSSAGGYGVRINADCDGGTFANNKVICNPTAAIDCILRIDAQDVIVSGNYFSGSATAVKLVRIGGQNCKLRDNYFTSSSGAIVVSSATPNTEFTSNTFNSVTNPFSEVATGSSGTVIQNNVGAGTIPNFVPTLTVTSQTITVLKVGKYRVSIGSAGSTNLATINGGQPGEMIFLTRYSGSENVTLVSTGNIVLGAGGNYLLGAGVIGLVYTGAAWNEMFRT